MISEYILDYKQNFDDDNDNDGTRQMYATRI